MTSWWVNHKQTRKEEIEGGYIWSPTSDKDGSRNQTYLNLKAVKIGDIVFSYALGAIGAVGVVEPPAATQTPPLVATSNSPT